MQNTFVQTLMQRNKLAGMGVALITPFKKDGTVDYDKLAREEYQFETGLEEIEKFRLQIMDDVEARYAAGDFSSLTKDLQGFGYGTAEIATILASKSMTINAMLDGNTRQIVAAKAQEMAKADGVQNYQSSYSNKQSTDELKCDKKPLKSLHLNSDNKLPLSHLYSLIPICAIFPILS